ncbi:MAG: hypothetical protein KAT05_09080 [Spirochaetes bacterium]|nr:hypothetical protein [Spirochaetota bacterium]
MLKSKKLLVIILILIISPNLTQAEVVNTTIDGTLTNSEIKQFIEIYLRTYSFLANIQQDVDKASFDLHNKTFFIDTVISNQEQVAYVFNEVESETTKIGYYRTNETIGSILFPNIFDLAGRNILYRHISIVNATIPDTFYYYVLQTDFKSIKPEFAESFALHHFMSEYRDLIVDKAKRFAKENTDYKICSERLYEQNLLIKDREKMGVYTKDPELFKKDDDRFFELAYECGINNKEQAERFRNLPFPKKEFLGIDGRNYENNLYGYIVPFFILMLLSTILRTKIEKIRIEFLEKYYDIISIPAIAVYFYAIKPFDIQIYESLIIILIFLVFTIFILRYEMENKSN